MDKENALDDQKLAALFAEVKAIAPSPELLAKVLADADHVAGAGRSTPRRKRHPVRAILSAIGGWPAMAGLVSATVAGVWIGFSPPTGFDSYLSGVDGYDLGDFMPLVDDLTEES